MTRHEIDTLMTEITWGTLCGVLPDGTPYATEVTYLNQDNTVLCLSHSKGTMARCLTHCPRVCFKICDSGPLSRPFRAVSLFGHAAFHQPPSGEEMIDLWQQLEARVDEQDRYAVAKQRCLDGKIYPVLRINVERITGITDRESTHHEG